jgi:hypothetical protein
MGADHQGVRRAGGLSLIRVMAGLVPAIHVFGP